MVSDKPEINLPEVALWKLFLALNKNVVFETLEFWKQELGARGPHGAWGNASRSPRGLGDWGHGMTFLLELRY